jgi:hypothetical protein
LYTEINRCAAVTQQTNLRGKQNSVIFQRKFGIISGIIVTKFQHANPKENFCEEKWTPL